MSDLAEQFIIRGDFVRDDGRHTTHYVAAEAIRLQPEAAARCISELLTDLEDSAQDVLSLADKVSAIERMHPAGVSPPHELGELPALCAGCDVYTITDDETDEIHSLSTDELNAIWDDAEKAPPAGDPDDDTWAGPVQIVATALDETPMGLNTVANAAELDGPHVAGENWPKEWRQFWDEPWTVRGAKACLRALAEAGLLKEEAL